MTLFARLRGDNGLIWDSYTNHKFVKQIANGTLKESSFKYYLSQDYLFLIHFARAYALAAYKSDNLADIRQAGQTNKRQGDQNADNSVTVRR